MAGALLWGCCLCGAVLRRPFHHQPALSTATKPEPTTPRPPQKLPSLGREASPAANRPTPLQGILINFQASAAQATQTAITPPPCKGCDRKAVFYSQGVRVQACFSFSYSFVHRSASSASRPLLSLPPPLCFVHRLRQSYGTCNVVEMRRRRRPPPGRALLAC